MLGRTLGHYTILKMLGEGGMGVVYQARDTRLDRLVALKVLSAEALAIPQRSLRFVQEAKSASALNHPNIIAIYDIGTADGVDFIAMEYVPGTTLQQLISQKKIGLDETLRYAVQLADALATAHAANIVHRDLKPANVMVTERGLVKVLDFGLAKLTEPAAGEDGVEASGDTRTLGPLTEQGTIVGTVAYMSPEQAEGKEVDWRSDIFSFGSVLYEMVTAQRAFARETKMSTLSAVLHFEPKPVSENAKGVPAELEKLIARCLRKDPNRRIQHMDDVKLALDELKEESDSGGAIATRTEPGRIRKPRRLRALIWTVAALAALAAAITGVWLLRPTAKLQPAQMKAVPLTTYPGNEDSPSFSPDGSQMVFSWNGEREGNTDIYVRQVDTGTPLRLTTDAAADTSPAWSPDGRFIAFLRNVSREKATVIVIPALGGPERRLADAESGFGGPHLSWSPDSKHLVIIDRSVPEEPTGLFVLSVQTREKRRLLMPLAKSIGDGSPAVSPDGRRLAFSRSPSYVVNDLYIVPLSDDLRPTGEPKRLTFDNRRLNSLAWTPDGRKIVFSSDRLGTSSLWRISPDGRGKPEQVDSVGQDAGALAISRRHPDGAFRLAYVHSLRLDRDIWRLPLSSEAGKAGRPVRFITSTRDDTSPRYSPDGKRIAFGSDRSGSYEIWVCDSDGTNAVQLTSFGGPVTDYPSWSPDGKRIAFHSRPEGQAEIYVINAEGGQPQRLTREPAEAVAPSWSRDGKWIYFGSKRTGEHQIWKVPAGGGTAVQMTKNGGIAAFESPDSKFLYYTKVRGTTSLWKAPVTGGPESKVVDSLFYLNFAVAEEGIYFASRDLGETRRGRGSIALLGFGGDITEINGSGEPPIISGGISSLTTSPDRRWLLYVVSERRGGQDLMLLDNFR
jgi:Tol biopolymer transport system component/predicted Ser/Thr protein kinase